MTQTSVNLPPEMVKEIDAIVEESNVYESRSHFIRAAIRDHKNDENEFSRAT